MLSFFHRFNSFQGVSLQHVLVLPVLTVLAGCAGAPDDTADRAADVDWDAISMANQAPVSWREDVQPVLEQRCVVCHGCFDAPCQLKLTSYDGLERGANPEKVYNQGRIRAAQPTRLNIDAEGSAAWREKGFHPVLAETEIQSERDAADFMRNSVLYRMLRLKQRNPQPRTGLLPDSVTIDLSRKQVCTTEEKIAKFERDNPLWGMPYGMPNLADQEYKTLVRWLAQGAKGPEPTELPAQELAQIEEWERFLNGGSPREQLMSRYLYEHLFLGHLHFADADERHFYRLVRSSTPPGEAIREIPTVRPFEDPGSQPFWYRLRLFDASIVAKAHVTYELSAQRLERFRELFLASGDDVDELPGYDLPEAANPFVVFDDLPIRSRYLFMLDDARFFIQGFIKGPVCRGQVALNVIEDQFWVFFLDPDVMKLDLSEERRRVIYAYLEMPSKTQTYNPVSAYTKYWKAQKEYLSAKGEYYSVHRPSTQEGALGMVWDGDGVNPNAALTVFRNFDSAAVEFGLHGKYPETAWIIDYPLFERIHYLLVAGYDVYGNVGHQLNSRLFMDFLRMEGEDNFLAFLPKGSREEIRAGWYQGIRSKRKKLFEEPMSWLSGDSPINFTTNDPQTEFYELMLDHLGAVAGPPDLINRCPSETCAVMAASASMPEPDAVMSRLADLRGHQLQVFPELALVRVGQEDGAPDLAYTLIVNRDWKNITSFLEDAGDGQRDPAGDTLTVLRGFSGSYPNFFFDVQENELNAFVTEAAAVQNAEDYQSFVARYGVRRTDAKFWQQADWFQAEYQAQHPAEAGILDLNRYENR